MFARSAGVVGWAYRSALSLSFKHRLWLPFLCVALAQGVILLLLLSFHRSGFNSVLVPVVQAVGGETATHYPFFFFYLPMIFSRLMLVFAAVGASLAVGAATILFAQAFGHRPGKAAWRHAARRYPTLLVVSALLGLVIYGISQLSALIPRELFQENKLIRWGTRAGIVFLFILAQSLLIYATAWVVLKGHRVLPAIRDSVRVALRTLVPTFLIVAIPVLMLFPLDYLGDRADLFATKLNPEMTAGLLGLRILVDMVLSFMLVGAVTRLFMLRMESAR